MVKRQRFTKEFKLDAVGSGNHPGSRQRRSPVNWAYDATICMNGKPNSTRRARWH